MNKFLKTVLIIIILFIVFAAGGLFYLTRGLDAGSSLAVDAVNVSTIEDGTYIGEYNSGRWSNQVKVTVKEHKITKIDIVKDVVFPKPEWTEQLISRVIEKQNTDVDVVSGATITSKAYLKSIENALKKGGR